MSKSIKLIAALAVLTAMTSATAVNASSGNPTSLCGKVWKPRC